MVTMRLLSPTQRTIFSFASILLVVAVLGCAATIPFVWPSTSLWYKTGSDKLVLQIGKVFGLCAAVLFFVQILLVQRLVIFDRIWGLDRLSFFHRINSFLILALAITHSGLVILPEGLDNLPIGREFWPEMVGAALVITLAFFIAVALYRRRLLAYDVWRKVHRPVGYLLAAVLIIHIFNVSDSFETGVPRGGLWGFIGAIVLTIILAKFLAARMTLKQLPVSAGRQAGEGVVGLRVEVPSSFSYAPGQFAFLTLHGGGIAPETHPFSISSAPDFPTKRSSSIEFFIKQCGDWTSTIAPEKGLQASLMGPFGLFSYKARPLPPMIVCIGGGIGITPLLSMLRQLSTEQDAPALMLVWSVTRKSDMFLSEELTELQSRLPFLHTHIIYTGGEGGRRLHEESLSALLKDVPDNSHFYICGPEPMMSDIRGHLQQLRYLRKSIFWERFSL
jgi:predicted ferric reductase